MYLVAASACAVMVICFSVLLGHADMREALVIGMALAADDGTTAISASPCRNTRGSLTSSSQAMTAMSRNR